MAQNAGTQWYVICKEIKISTPRWEFRRNKDEVISYCIVSTIVADGPERLNTMVSVRNLRFQHMIYDMFLVPDFSMFDWFFAVL